MRVVSGRVVETQLFAGGVAALRVSLPAPAVPAPGQYLMAYNPEDGSAALAVPLFPAEISEGEFLAAPPVPPHWQAGTELKLRGPLGRGFALPPGLRRLALAALGGSVARLLPLVRQALQGGCDAALFTGAPLPQLPAALEVHPESALPEAVAWADFLALDLPLEALPGLRLRLGLRPADYLPCPAQALIFTAMPCGGVGECGACAVEGRRGWKLACEDGPVFNTDTLKY